MAKVIVCLFGFVAAILALHTPRTSSFSPRQIQLFKEALEDQIKDSGLTRDNYHQHCASASGDEPRSVCRIMLEGYLRDNLKDLAGIRKIMSRIRKQHPEFTFAGGQKSDDDDDDESEEKSKEEDEQVPDDSDQDYNDKHEED